MEYTKGEWKVTRWNSTRGLHIKVGSVIIASIEKITPQNEANAHLIAAAPAMEEALEKLLRVVKGDGNRPHHNACYGEIDPHPDCALCNSITIEELGYKALALAKGKE